MQDFTLVPFYWAWPGQEAPIVAQAVLLASAILPIVAFARLSFGLSRTDSFGVSSDSDDRRAALLGQPTT